MVRYFGVLSSRAKLRSEVVPQPEPPTPGEAPDATEGQLMLLPMLSDEADAQPRRKPWSWLLKHVFLADVSTCERCGGDMRWLEVATTPEAIERLMDHQVDSECADSGPPARASPQLLLPLDEIS